MRTAFQWLFIMIMAAVLPPDSAYAQQPTLRWAAQGDALSFDPHAVNSGATRALVLQTYEPLIRLSADLRLEPALATKWEQIKPDTWELTLRREVRFHDGASFNAEDVVFSINRAKGETSDFKNYLSGISLVTVVDDFRVRLTTKHPDTLLPNNLANIMMMDADWSRSNQAEVSQNFYGNEESYPANHANGTGPFVLLERVPGLQTRWARNQQWWGGPVAFDGLVFTPIANGASRTLALLAGEVDIVTDPQLQDLPRFSADPRFRVLTATQVRTIFFGLDVGSEQLRHTDGPNPLKDRRVREAIYRSIDSDALHERVMQGFSRPAGSLVPPGVAGFDPSLDARIGYSPDIARKLLADAGFSDGLSLTVNCMNDRFNNDEQICQALVPMLAQVGINVRLDIASVARHTQELVANGLDFYMLGWSVSSVDALNVLKFLYLTKGDTNFTSYSSATMDEMISKIEIEGDPAKRDALLHSALLLAKEEMIYIPLHNEMSAWVVSARLQMPVDRFGIPQFSIGTWD